MAINNPSSTSGTTPTAASSSALGTNNGSNGSTFQIINATNSNEAMTTSTSSAPVTLTDIAPIQSNNTSAYTSVIHSITSAASWFFGGSRTTPIEATSDPTPSASPETETEITTPYQRLRQRRGLTTTDYTPAERQSRTTQANKEVTGIVEPSKDSNTELPPETQTSAAIGYGELMGGDNRGRRLLSVRESAPNTKPQKEVKCDIEYKNVLSECIDHRMSVYNAFDGMLTCSLTNNCDLMLDVESKTTTGVHTHDWIHGGETRSCIDGGFPKTPLNAKSSLGFYPVLGEGNVFIEGNTLTVGLIYSIPENQKGGYVLVSVENPALHLPIDRVVSNGKVTTKIPDEWKPYFVQLRIVPKDDYSRFLGKTKTTPPPRLKYTFKNLKGNSVKGQVWLTRGQHSTEKLAEGSCQTSSDGTSCDVELDVTKGANYMHSVITREDAGGGYVTTIKHTPLKPMPDCGETVPICFVQKGSETKQGKLGEPCNRVQYSRRTSNNIGAPYKVSELVNIEHHHDGAFTSKGEVRFRCKGNDGTAIPNDIEKNEFVGNYMTSHEHTCSNPKYIEMWEKEYHSFFTRHTSTRNRKLEFGISSSRLENDLNQVQEERWYKGEDLGKPIHLQYDYGCLRSQAFRADQYVYGNPQDDQIFKAGMTHDDVRGGDAKDLCPAGTIPPSSPNFPPKLTVLPTIEEEEE